MQQLVNTKKILLGFSLIFLIFFSCRQRTQVFQKKVLFELELGRMEKQLDMTIHPDPSRFIRDNYVYVNGHFYIANSRINKVMELTSYGDLLSLYYDPFDNPAPVTLSDNLDETLVSNLNAYSHPFENIGLITVDSNKILFIEDQVVRERAEIDPESGIPLDRVIRRFQASGEEENFIGQEGELGTPFPFINSMHVSKEDDLTVVCRTPDNWEVFSYSTGDEKLKQKIVFDSNALPGQAEYIIADLENIIPDYANSRLYLKINYYEKRFGKTDGPMGVIYFKETSVWVFDIENDRFILHFDLPQKQVRDPVSEESHDVLYDLMGIDKKGSLFFKAMDEGNLYEILIISGTGNVIDRIKIMVDEEDLYFRQFYISSEGILSGMFTYGEKIEFAWWRTDYIIRGTKN